MGRYLTPLQNALRMVLLNLNAGDARALVQRMVWSEREQRVSPFGERLRSLFTDIKLSWSRMMLDVGLVPDDAAHRLKLQIFMDGIFALFERYCCAWLDGHYDSELPLVDALAHYVMDFWQSEIDAFFSVRNQPQ